MDKRIIERLESIRHKESVAEGFSPFSPLRQDLQPLFYLRRSNLHSLENLEFGVGERWCKGGSRNVVERGIHFIANKK